MERIGYFGNVDQATPRLFAAIGCRMKDLFSRWADRAVGVRSAIVPALPSRFASWPVAHGTSDVAMQGVPQDAKAPDQEASSEGPRPSQKRPEPEHQAGPLLQPHSDSDTAGRRPTVPSPPETGEVTPAPRAAATGFPAHNLSARRAPWEEVDSNDKVATPLGKAVEESDTARAVTPNGEKNRVRLRPRHSVDHGSVDPGSDPFAAAPTVTAKPDVEPSHRNAPTETEAVSAPRSKAIHTRPVERLPLSQAAEPDPIQPRIKRERENVVQSHLAGSSLHNQKTGEVALREAQHSTADRSQPTIARIAVGSLEVRLETRHTVIAASPAASRPEAKRGPQLALHEYLTQFARDGS
jgi:hypothetical protein